MQQFTRTTAANTRKGGTKNKKHKEKQKNINDWIVWLADNWSLNTNQDAHRHKGHRLLFSV